MTLATSYIMSQLPNQMFAAGSGELVINTSDYDSGELTIVTGWSKITSATANFREDPGVDLPPIWCDFTSTAGTIVFSCANVDGLEISFQFTGLP